jgi:hypothetical protein
MQAATPPHAATMARAIWRQCMGTWIQKAAAHTSRDRAGPGRAGRQAVQIMHIARVLERICAGNATVRRSRSPDCPVGGQRNSEVVK